MSILGASIGNFAAGVPTTVAAPPATAPDPISYWKLAGNLNDDKSVSNGSFTGTPETGVTSIVTGLASSIASQADAYGTIPHNSAYAKASFTLIFTCQADTVGSTNRVLLAKPNNAQGEISLEQYNNGGAPWFRGYLTGAGPTVRWLGSNTGAFAMPVDQAFQVALRVSSVDGVDLLYRTAAGAFTEVPSAHIAATDCGLDTNTAAWSVFAYGAGLSVFDGVLGGIMFFDVAMQQSWLNDPAVVPAPVTVTHSHGGTTTSIGPAVPALDFLPGTGSLPASNLVYVYDTGLGNGSGANAANAKELQAAINAATAGQTLVAIAATAGGTSYYNRPSGLTFGVSGGSGNPITLRARPGDTVVIDHGAQLSRFRNKTSGTNANWELYDNTLKIWRSTATFSGSAGGVVGHWWEFGWPHYLIPADTLAHLQAPLGTARLWTNYAAPCATLHTDGRIYIRMQRPYPAKMSYNGKWPKRGQAGGAIIADWDGWTNSSGQIAFPVTEDPREYSIWMVRSDGGSSPYTFHFNSGVSNWGIGDGINSCLGTGCWWLEGGNNNFTIGRGTDLPFRFGLFVNSGNPSNWTFNKRRMGAGSLRHMSLLETKYGGVLEGAYRGTGWEVNWQTSAGFTNVTSNDCTFYGFHDMAVRGGTAWKFMRCTFYRIFDDGFQCDVGVYNNFEFHYCYFLDSSMGGPGGHGTDPGSHKYSHCIFDARLVKVFDVASTGSWEPYSEGLDPLHLDWAFGCSDPRKLYNCTFIESPDVTSGRGPIPFNHLGGAKPNGSSVYAEGWNCILAVISNERYTGGGPAGQQSWVGPRDGVAYALITQGSNEAWDYAMIWRDCPFHPQTPSAFSQGPIVANNTADSGYINFSTIAAFKGSTQFTQSKAKYAPGFLNSSVIEDPQIPSAVRSPASFDVRKDYRPRNARTKSLARTATSTTIAGESTAGWTVLPSPWMGALDPDDTTTMPVGPQNP
jgi:hypothetical protein